MSRHKADILWTEDGDFAANRYSRGHQWRFDGGVCVRASASPAVVPQPLSDPAAIDPEEAFVASLSACHMLWFLDLARQAGLTVRRYRDRAVGELARLETGQLGIPLVTLRPDIDWGPPAPDAATVAALHEQAHARCFLANSVKTEIRIAPAPDPDG